MGLLLSPGVGGGRGGGGAGAWSLSLHAELGPGLGEREEEAWAGRLGTGGGGGEGLYRPAGLEGLPRTFCGQTHSSILTSHSGSPGPGGGQARAWTRGDRVWRVMTPVIPQVSVSRHTHEGAGAGRT